MSIKRLFTLLGKEIVYGSKSFIVIWVIIAPLLITLVFSLVFGTFFTEKPKVGIYDEGSSKLAEMLEESDSLIVKKYDSLASIKAAVEKGVVDIGLELPLNFDVEIKSGEKSSISVFIWGESLAKNRMIAGVIITSKIRELTGLESPIIIDEITLGDAKAIPWEDRIFPFIVLMAVFLGGFFIPATSLVEEKSRKTLQAVVVTPATIPEIFLSKGLLGFIVSILMGIIILFLNKAFGVEPLLLVFLLALGAVMATTLGLISGIFFKDFATLFGVWKSGAIILFLPAITYMFPKIPSWIGKIVPTYYIIEPIVKLTQYGKGWAEIHPQVFALIGVDLLLICLLIVLLKSKSVESLV